MNPSEKTGIEPLLPMKLVGEGIYTLFVISKKKKNQQNKTMDRRLSRASEQTERQGRARSYFKISLNIN